MIAFILLLACSDDTEKVEKTEGKGPSVKTETPVKQKTVETVDLEIEVEATTEEQVSE